MHYFQNLTAHSRPQYSHRKPPPWRIALVANIVDEVEASNGGPPDYGAEFDGRETVEAIAAALESDGHWVHICAGDHTLPESLRNLRPHICFNIAEGQIGDAREAQVPALCELLGIPYTASRVLANAISLDKAQTKRIWQSRGLPTARFQEFREPHEPLNSGLAFPLLVKPSREGSGMGLDSASIVRDKRALHKRIISILHEYRQPAIAEECLPGREFTVGYLGNPGSSHARRRPWIYNSEGYHFFPILEVETTQSLTPGIYGHDAKSRAIGSTGAPEYLCPAPIDTALAGELLRLAQLASEAIGACDVSRVDFRLDAAGQPNLLEINTLPGLNPLLSDLCIMAAAEGMEYPVLISEILYLGAGRFGLPFEAAMLEIAIVVHPESMRPLSDSIPAAQDTNRSLRRWHGL